MSEGQAPEVTNGTPPEEPTGPPIFMPPAEMMVNQLNTRLGEQSIELFQLRSAAEFQSGIIQHLQQQLQETGAELAKYKTSDLDEVLETENEKEE